MFRNPVFDLMIVVPALLIAGLLSLFIMTGSAHAAELTPLPSEAQATTTPGPRAVTASTSGSTLPDPTQKTIIITRAAGQLTESPGPALAVRTSDDLQAYARAVIAADPYVQSISLSGHEIAVNYRKQGRLLGLLPVAVPTTATVHTDGSVTFSEPWYGTVTLAARDRMKTALEVRVHALLTTEGYLASMQFAPVTQAEVLEMVRDLLA